MNAYRGPGTPLTEIYQLARVQRRDESYIAGLEDLVRIHGEEALAICRKWHGPYFAWPGHGGLAFVSQQLQRATDAILVLNALRA